MRNSSPRPYRVLLNAALPESVHRGRLGPKSQLGREAKKLPLTQTDQAVFAAKNIQTFTF
jgi:hypothetical protein